MRGLLNFIHFTNHPLGCIVEILETSVANDSKTLYEIRRLLESFLEARRVALPRRIEKALQQEDSQDYWGDLGIDLNDPAVIALIDGTNIVTSEIEEQDRKAASVSLYYSPYEH